MNTILIYPQLEFSTAQVPVPPYSILFIADYLIKHNIEVDVFDLRFDNSSRVMDCIGEYEPQYIGISVMTGPQIYHALKVCEKVKKEFPNLKIVWGGIHSTILPAQTIQTNLIDVVVRGEGEKPYYELVSGKNINTIKGITLKKNNKIHHNPSAPLISNIELNSLSIPWELVDAKRYIKNHNFNMITSRGCPLNCAFCYNTLFNNVWRGWTADKCIQEIQKVIAFGATKINFYDDNFFANPKRLPSLFKFLKEHKIIWKAEMRVDRLNYSLAKDVKLHGCNQLYFGVESGSPRILKVLNKCIKVDEIIKSAKITNKLRISADYSWMIGIPSETKEDIRSTIRLVKIIKEINPDSEFTIKILFPYPKTPIYEQAINLGFQPPKNLLAWANTRREQASNYLKSKNVLETISITSAIVGKKVFEQKAIPALKLIRKFAEFRWKKEIFIIGLESLFFSTFRTQIDKQIANNKEYEYDPFLRQLVKNKNKNS